MFESFFCLFYLQIKCCQTTGVTAYGAARRNLLDHGKTSVFLLDCCLESGESCV